MDGNMKKMREKLVQELERGKESATQIRNILHDHHDNHDGCFKLGQLDAHSSLVFISLDNALSMLHSLSFSDDTTHNPNQNLENPNLNPFMIQEFGHLEPYKTTPHDGEGSPKKRKGEELLSIETSNTDDNYAWRKYGQKTIQQSDHPRSYYRCTHKSEQGCQATKQVQQISEDPAKFKITYRGHHTCNKNPPNNPPNLLDLIDEQDNSPTNFLCFEEPAKHGALSPKFMLFPSSSSSSSSSHMGNATVEQEYVFPMKETPSAPFNIQYCPSSLSSDLTTTITHGHSSVPGSHELAMSLAEVYSSAATTHDPLDGEDYNIMSETVDFSDVFQDCFDLFLWS